MSQHLEKLPNYIRAHRKRLCLSQQDLAYLMGCKCGAKFSRYEQFKVRPKLETAFMCGIVAKEPLDRLFEGLYQEAVRRVARRAAALLREYRKRERTPEVERKIRALEAICSLDA